MGQEGLTGNMAEGHIEVGKVKHLSLDECVSEVLIYWECAIMLLKVCQLIMETRCC